MTDDAATVASRAVMSGGGTGATAMLSGGWVERRDRGAMSRRGRIVALMANDADGAV